MLMTPELDTFRIDLRSAKLCMELDCNTIFDSVRHRHCPTCGSVESYPLESWLNRDRSARGRSGRREEWIEAIPSLARPVWVERLVSRRAQGDAPMGPVPAEAREPVALQRRAG
jgi:hypothetical protein